MFLGGDQVIRTPSDEERVCKQFDSYIKLCITREMINYEDKQERRVIREKNNVEYIDELFENDESEDYQIPDFIIEGLRITIKSEKLLSGLKSIRDLERDIVIFINYLDKRVAEIAQSMEVSEQYIYRIYNKALYKLKKHMEEENEG